MGRLRTAIDVGLVVAGIAGAALLYEAGHDLTRKRDYFGHRVNLGSMVIGAPRTRDFEPLRKEAAQEAGQALAGYALLGVAAYGMLKR